MSIKVVVAVGNKKIERFIAQMDTIDVLTTIRRKEAVLDAIINYNPHVVVLSRELSGKIEMTDVIRRCRSLKEKCRVVFIYGEIDTEYKYFSYFLVQQGIYNILTGAVDAERLEDVIERVYTLEDIVGYLVIPTISLFKLLFILFCIKCHYHISTYSSVKSSHEIRARRVLRTIRCLLGDNSSNFPCKDESWGVVGALGIAEVSWNSSAMSTCKALQIEKRVSTVGFPLPRSIHPR